MISEEFPLFSSPCATQALGNIGKVYDRSVSTQHSLIQAG